MRAACYVRVSTDAQSAADKTSLQTQLDACRAYCAGHGYQITSEYVEVYSGGGLDRPQLNLLREQVRAGKVDVVVIYAFDRLSRKQLEPVLVLEEAIRHGARIESVTEPIDHSPVGVFIFNTYALTAELERLKILERTQRGKLAILASGRPLRNNTPYGYVWNAERPGWDAAEPAASVVRRIFADLAAGVSCTALAHRLTAEGIPPPRVGRQWWVATIAVLAHNPIYAGRLEAHRLSRKKTRLTRHAGIVLPEAAPALVAPEVWAQVQTRLENNRTFAARNNRHDGAYLLRGLVHCAACGRRMWADAPRGRTTYRCRGHRQPAPTCDARTRISATWLDSSVWDDLVTALRDELDKRPRRLARPDAAARSQLTALDKRLADAQRRQANLLTALANASTDAQGPILAAFETGQVVLNTGQAERAQIVARLEATGADADGTQKIVRLARSLAPLLAAPNLPMSDRRAIVRELGITVQVWPEGGADRYLVDGLW